MKFSTLYTVLPVLALAAPAFGTPLAKKRACTRPSASVSASASMTAAESSAVDSASATVSPISSVNTGVFAPGPSDASSATMEPSSSASAVESSAPASSAEPTSAVESSAQPTASVEPSSSESMAPSSTSSAPAESSSAASSDSDAELFVRLHNDFRAQYDAPAVEWDEELAQFAKDYAPICQMQHSSGPYGENLAGGAGNGYDIERAFTSWANEGQYYNYSQPGVLEATVDGESMGLGHFTQLVWKSTTKIGCAAVSCADGTLFTGYGDSLFVVCEYSPAGNVYMSGGDPNALFVENVGQKIA